MPNLLAMSFEGELAPSFDLRCLRPDRTLPDGWGIGYYPGGEPSATVLKEPAPPSGSIRSQLVAAWEHLESSLFVVHIRHATWGSITDANTQPFTRTWGRRDWLFAHAGSLKQRPELDRHATFEPIGSTDTELILCELMNRFAECGWHSVGDADLDTLRSWFKSMNELGVLTAVLTDGRDLCVYADRDAEVPIHYWEAVPPYGGLVFADSDLAVDLGRRGVKSRRGVVVSSSTPLEVAGDGRGAWQQLAPGHLLVIRQGTIRAHAAPAAAPGSSPSPPWTVPRFRVRPSKAEVRRYDIRHRTAYRYERPVERSMHLFRLAPVHDRLQTLLRNEITVSVDGLWRDYEDVFGNRVRRLLIDSPFTELTIEATSRVEVLDTDPLSYRPLRARSTIPLVWMPWHQQVLRPYLLPPELAESELLELSEYAMSFVERNDSDLLDTLLDMNHSIWSDYQYVPGATTLQTSAFEVYTSRRGVCQDFTNLFICLARLLGVPARYVCGYIRTERAADSRQADASHAWVQVYLPEVGWKGFDPTNGILTQTDHVRVAVGRNYRDATPTSGVIYVGGGSETLEVAVEVTPLA
jgi:transglutaminase-like putative cysteine protease/predicted glutamine amidotransferase